MKIAIQVTGHLRTFKNLERSFYENVIKYNKDKGHEVDVFMCTIRKKLTDDEVKLFHLSKPILINYIDDDKVFINKMRTDEDIKNREEWLYKHHYLQFFRLLQCNNMRKSYEQFCGIKYDVIFRTRFDLVYYQPVDFDRPLGERRIYVANERHVRGTPSDVCAYSTPDIINELIEMYNRNCGCPHTPLNSFNWVKYIDVDIVRSVNETTGQYIVDGPKLETSSFEMEMYENKYISK
jgi:hypothetical protein